MYKINVVDMTNTSNGEGTNGGLAPAAGVAAAGVAAASGSASTSAASAGVFCRALWQRKGENLGASTTQYK